MSVPPKFVKSPVAVSISTREARWDPLRGREGFAEVLECVGVPGEGGVELEGMDR
jgi:hypothetical protein